MSYLASGLAVEDHQFQLRLAACLYKLAMDVENESPDAPDHETRLALAQQILYRYSIPTLDFAWRCVINPSIAASITVVGDTATVEAPDGDIEFVCASNFTLIAQLRSV